MTGYTLKRGLGSADLFTQNFFSGLGNVIPHGACIIKARLWQGFLCWRSPSLKTLFFLDGKTSPPGKLKMKASAVFVSVSPLILYFLGYPKHIGFSGSSLPLPAIRMLFQKTGVTASSSHQDPTSLAGGAGVLSRPLLALEGYLFQGFFPVHHHSTIFQELEEMTCAGWPWQALEIWICSGPSNTNSQSFFSLSFPEQWYELMDDQIQQLK